MRTVSFTTGLLLPLLLAACGEKPSTMEEVDSTEVTLPNGTKILAEAVEKKADMMRGMMFRNSLGANRGMLFIYAKEDRIPYWTFQVRIPLDIIWMDHQHRVVDLSLNTPPCLVRQSDSCPSYGGREP
ncbi:MAG: DUF192 domain-containing protein, partial [Bryobacteraceae bacterium]